MNSSTVPSSDPTLAAAKLAEVRGFVFDIDGTLALADKRLSGYQPLPGACELLALLRQRGVPHVGFTNGSTKTPQKLSEALTAIGIELDERHTMTPVSVAVDLFQRRRYKRLLVLGGEGVWKPLVEAGFDVVRSPERADDADAVLIGWHPDFVLADLDAACRAVWAGAAFYTVSKAAVVASREGRTLGISGALSAAVQSVTGKRAVVVGKPSAQAMSCASGRLGGLKPAQMAIVGDDISLENAMALRGGAMSIGVHTGLSNAEDFANLPAGSRPHLSISGVDRLLELLS
ncbi:MAG: HAD hydrolase-like protein [Rhodoferax sp.]|uniref:HAD-IIA family hydrolase n=1 Tax=Rhodoferax sp. TaxID=50421 RepID=UPI00271ED1C1|nr:HAD hydrolase-like protein [Rhodoferax sp.]MDO8449877.1 HAD hydrolase-like protein [Rhodoferax sp.]